MPQHCFIFIHPSSSIFIHLHPRFQVTRLVTGNAWGRFCDSGLFRSNIDALEENQLLGLTGLQSQTRHYGFRAACGHLRQVHSAHLATDGYQWNIP